MELHQKALLEKRSFFLLPNKLKIYIKNTDGEQEDYITYESLKGEAKLVCRRNSNLLFLAMATVSFAICLGVHTLFTSRNFGLVIFPCAIAIIITILYQTKQQKYTALETFDRRKIILLHNKPNRQVLERFLRQLWVQRREYLRDKYFYISQSHEKQQQTNRLRWLLEQNIITKAEFKFAQEDWIIDKSYQSHRQTGNI